MMPNISSSVTAPSPLSSSQYMAMTCPSNIWVTALIFCFPSTLHMAPHSSTLAWKIPWMEEPGRLQSMGSLRVGHDWATSLSLSTFMHWRRKWQPTPVFLPGESQGRWSLMGCRHGSHRVGHDWNDLAVAVALCIYHCISLWLPW